jgi:MFS family permease
VSDPPRRLGGGVLLVAALCAILLLILLPYYSYSSLLVLIQAEWGMSSAEAGWVFGATQVGYVAAVLVLMPLTDRVSTARIILLSTVMSVAGNVLFPLIATDTASGALLRAVGGAGIAGTYMPGMRLISERFPGDRRGGPIGIYVAAFVLGGAVSFGATALLVPLLGWRGTYLAVSLAGVAATLVALALVVGDPAPPAPGRPDPPDPASVRQVISSRPLLLITAGYTAHVWELYGMRAWTAPFLAFLLIRMEQDIVAAASQAALISAIMVLLGAGSTGMSGAVSDRFGRTASASVILAFSAACSLLLGWLVGAPFWLVVAVCLVYGLWVNPDSPVYSTGVTELAPPSRLGTAMAFQSTSGWTAGIVAPVVFGWILDVAPGDTGWGFGFASMGVGALLGIVAMLLLRRMPESSLLAGGRR